MFNDDELEELIKCDKSIIDVKHKSGFKEQGQNFRKNLTLKSINGEFFRVFIRKHKELIENFSIGLDFLSNDKEIGELQLIRFNGAHGEEDRTKDGHYSAFHIHKTSEELLSQNKRRLSDIEHTDKYSSFDGAFHYFLNYINIINIDEYFPEYSTADLFRGF